MNKFEIPENVLDLIGDKIYRHAKLYYNIPIKAEYFESIVSTSLECDWKPMNHNPNQDMETQIPNMLRPSLKAGVVKNGFLHFSSHRTTEHQTLQDKIDFLNSREYDSYLCLTRDKESNKIHKYKLVYFPKHLIDWNSIQWIDTYSKKGKHSGYHGTNPDGTVRAKIVFSMSHQVWIDIDMNLTTILKEYEY